MKFSQWHNVLIVFLILGIISCESGQAKTSQRPDVNSEGRSAVQKQAETKSAKPEPGDTASLLLLITRLLDNNDYEAALVRFDRIDPKDAEKVEVRLLKVSVLISAGKNAEARSMINEILKTDPEYVPALLLLSSAEEAEDRNREQRIVLEKILLLEPDNVTALLSMGKLMIRSSTARQAGPYFDRVLASDPGNGEALLGRAWVYRNAREPKKAEELLNKAIELYPDWGRAYQERGRLYKSAGFYQAALADLDKAKALEADNYFIACDRGDALKNLNRKEEALAEYERAIAINPDYFLAYVFSSALKDNLGDYNGAFDDYKKLASLNPDYFFAFEGLGMHLMRLSRWLEARDAFMEAYKRAAKMGGGSQANNAGTEETMYALLAAVCALHGGTRGDARPFLDEALKRVTRDSMEYRMLRLYRDWAGDMDITNRIDREKNPFVKSRMLFYLAYYYDIRGNKNLASKLFLQVRDLEVKDMIEWRLNEWALEARGLALQ